MAEVDNTVWFAQAMAYIAGTCMTNQSEALTITAEEGQVLTEDVLVAFDDYLEANECRECEYCGWYTHPGEDCDCQNDEDECAGCGCHIDECECYDEDAEFDHDVADRYRGTKTPIR